MKQKEGGPSTPSSNPSLSKSALCVVEHKSSGSWYWKAVTSGPGDAGKHYTVLTLANIDVKVSLSHHHVVFS